MHARRGTPDPESHRPGRVKRPGVAAVAARLRERMGAITAAAAPAGGGAATLGAGAKPPETAGHTALHDLRVACRRLETALRLWARGSDAREARSRARAMRRAAGPAREHEVLRVLLRARRFGAASVPPAVRKSWLERLSRADAAARRGAFPSARAVERLASRVERAVRALDRGARLGTRASERLARWRRLGRSRLAAALASGEAGALHRARLALKRWRYAAEERGAFAGERVSAAGEVPPAPAAEPGAGLRRWQRALGQLNDRALLIAYARSGTRRAARPRPHARAARAMIS